MLQSLEEVINNPSLLCSSRCFIDKVSISYDFGVLRDTLEDSENTTNLDEELRNIKPIICRISSENREERITDGSANGDLTSGHLPRSCEENDIRSYGWIFGISGNNSDHVHRLAVVRSSVGNRPLPLFTGNLSFKTSNQEGAAMGKNLTFDGLCNPTRNLNFASDSRTYTRQRPINFGTNESTNERTSFVDCVEDAEFSLDGSDNWLPQHRSSRLTRARTDRYFRRYIWDLRDAMLEDILRGIDRRRSRDDIQLVETDSSYKVKFKKIEIYWEFLSLSPTLDVERLRPVLYSLSNGELRDTDYTISSSSGMANLWQNQIQNSRSLSIVPSGVHAGKPRIKIYAKTNKRVRIEVEFSPHNGKANSEAEITEKLNFWREKAEGFVQQFFNYANAIQGSRQSPLLSASVLELINAINFGTGNIEESNLVLSLLASNGSIDVPLRGGRSEYLIRLLRPLLAPPSHQRPRPQEDVRGGEPRIAIAVLRRDGRAYRPTPHFQRAVEEL